MSLNEGLLVLEGLVLSKVPVLTEGRVHSGLLKVLVLSKASILAESAILKKGLIQSLVVDKALVHIEGSRILFFKTCFLLGFWFLVKV